MLSEVRSLRNYSLPPRIYPHRSNDGGDPIMGRYLLLWMLGIPLPILVLIYAFGGLH
jgi:hypothetical protein